MGPFIKFLFSKTFIINLLIALLLLAGGLYATLNYLDDYSLHGQTLEVPNLEGKNFEQMDTLLNPTEFTAIITDSIYLKDKIVGEIVDQDPKPGKTVKQGRKIYITVAAAEPAKITMPDLVDLSLRQASSLMETYGLVVGKLSYRPDLCVNCILEQQLDGKPIAAGTKILKGIKIDLIIGHGLSNELTQVPYLIGMNTSMAESVLLSSYLNVGAVFYDADNVLTATDSAQAKVYKQSPFYSEGPTIQMGSSVDLFVTMDTNRIVHTVNPTDTL
ncbi:MAG: PASTA domain-containing protein [Bacteroidetes bacterium]|nr:MAG: PASTA domain-containing protein [Bacteroidota bacterium]MBL1145217.1 PASTA domain-containing protein [Bacteroidota bacterium]MCB0803621.1 PASTA domain-containing protein [Flavobacteriales bacterium]NOG58013.1 PASTA domain-containing protein [Bacteroidota bacterium]